MLHLTLYVPQHLRHRREVILGMHPIIFEEIQCGNVPYKEGYENDGGDEDGLVDDDLCLDEGAMGLVCDRLGEPVAVNHGAQAVSCVLRTLGRH